jgi:Autotransporter beta-domain
LNLPKRKLHRFAASALSTFALAAASSAGAQLLATSARQLSSGSLKLVAYYQGVQDQTLNFSIAGAGSCSAKSGVPFACGQGGTLVAKGDGGAGLVKLVWQPWDRVQYYALAGLGDYSVRIPSATVASVLTGDTQGQIYGVGLKASIVPDTIVTPGIALDMSLTRSLYDFDRIYPSGTSGDSVDERLNLMTYQVAVETSHLFVLDQDWKVEPYGGVEWSRVQADLKDRGDGSHAGGQTDTVTPFLGLRIPVEDHEALFAEASFVGGYHYGAGLELRFR